MRIVFDEAYRPTAAAAASPLASVTAASPAASVVHVIVKIVHVSVNAVP